MQFHVNQLVNMSSDEILNIPKGKYSIQFSDGESILSNKKIIVSHFYWRLFREFPGCPIQIKHALTGKFTSDTHLSLGKRIFWDVFNNAVNRYDLLVWDMSRVFYEITNTIHNFTITDLSEYVTTASLHDIIEILYDPQIQKSKEDYLTKVTAAGYEEKATVAAIAEAHNVVNKVLYTNEEYLSHNGIKKLCNAKIVNKGQMIQLIGPRGFVHDINGQVFKRPIDVGYAEGLKTLYDSAIESRSAARALFMTTDPLEDSEYFNREMQLLCSVIHTLEGADCNNYQTMPWLVGADELQLLQGKYHMVDGKPELIWDSIDHLVDKTIQLRSITGCGNHDPQTICRTCLGWSSNIIQPETNVGYAIATILCAIISQIMLSTKHYEASAGSQEFELNDRHMRWIRTCKTDKGYVLLQKNMVKKNPIIRLDVNAVRQLNNIQSVDVNELPPSRITNCLSFGIAEGDKHGNCLSPFEELKTTISGQGIYLSTEVLQYLKINGWDSNPKYIEFQLKDWNPDDPIFLTPRLGDNIYLFLQEIKSFIMPTKESEISILDYTSRGGAVAAFVNILKKRLKFNITQVEIFVRACMTVNGENDNYLLPHSTETFQFMSARHCLYNRSLTTLLAYETQAAAIGDTNWYKKIPRSKHMLDDILKSN